MKLGCCRVRFYLHGNGSLKGKRQVVRSMKDRVRNKFNVSVAEIGDQDIWQQIQLGIAAVGTDSQYLDGLLQQVVHYLEGLHLAELTDFKTELIHVGHPHT